VAAREKNFRADATGGAALSLRRINRDGQGVQDFGFSIFDLLRCRELQIANQKSLILSTPVNFSSPLFRAAA
jgi:hypothetical protein